MKNFSCFLQIIGLVLAYIAPLRGENENVTLQCLKSAAFLAPADSPDHRKYAPDREIQVIHLALDVTPDFAARTISGKAVILFKPLIKPVRELRLDAVALTIESVTSTEAIQAYQSTEQNLVITFANTIPADKEASVTIKYRAEPTRGLYFRTPEMGYKEGDTHLFSQGEEIEARHWYPCFDAPNIKFTSEVTCRVPEGMTVISNGRLVSQEKDPATGLMAVHWTQEKPHANYLITLVAGYFKKLEGKHKEVPLAFYTPPSEFDAAATSFRDTEDIMSFFEEEIGVAYPWPKYDQVCVNDFVAGGMENTSATTLTDHTLFKEETENIRDSEGLVSHEMAHQWFGDLVTCKDWSHIWLNEGFATYYETLYAEHKHGRDQLLYELYQRSRQITGITDDNNAIVRRNYDDPSEMFGYLAYPKGSWVLHMLRSQLGVELYRRCIKTYLERHQYGNVTTDDLRKVIEELTGRSYDQFFDQWVYHAHHPELEVSYSWDEPARLAKISIKQVQKLGENVLLFNFPLVVRFQSASRIEDRILKVTQKEEDFYVSLPEMPQSVRLDPEYTILAKISFNVPSSMLGIQLTNQTDLVGRLLAVEQLSKKQDRDSIAKLKQALNNDPFYGARNEAARALRSIHSDEARAALLASREQPDARVREAVTTSLNGFYDTAAFDSARKLLDSEKNPAIVSTALRGISGYAKPEVREAILKYLNSDSFRNELADAAISAIRLQDDPAYINPLLEVLQKNQSRFTSSGIAQGLSTLAYIARNEEKKEAVREFLVGHVNDRRKTVQRASINALGTLGDPKAIPVLEKFASAGKESRERAAAERAITDLRTARKPADDFKNLRQEVLDLQKANRDLRREMEELKKKVETPKQTSTSTQSTVKGKQAKSGSKG